MTEFYVIMQKRQDGKVYADLHKSTQQIYLTKEDAEGAFKYFEYQDSFHIVKLIACLDNEIKELEEEIEYLVYGDE
jgi:hypothetical protein